MQRNTDIRAVAVGLVMALVLAACTSTGTTDTSEADGGGTAPPDDGGVTTTTSDDGTPPATEGDGGEGGHLVWASREVIDNNFAVESDDMFTLRSIGVTEALTWTDFDGNLQPLLATEWSRTGDLTWEFTIREGVSFHDGTALDAAAVVDSLNFLLTREVQPRSFNTDSIASVEAVSDMVVLVTTTTPNTLVPLFLGTGNTVIMAASAYEGDAVDPVMAGTGPFVMTEKNLPESVSLVRNESYWGGSVGLASAQVLFTPDGGTRATLLQAGDSHLSDQIPIPLVPVLEADPNLTVLTADQPRTPLLYINHTRAPFDNILVRQAIQSAIDVELIAAEVLEGGGSPAVGPFAPSAAFAPAGAQPVTRDLARTQALFDEAGIDPSTLSMSIWTYASRPELPDIAVVLQGMLSEAGINVDVRVANYAALEPDMFAGDFDVALISRSYLVDVSDPIGFLQADYSCDGGFNLSHFCDPALDAQLDEILSLSEAADRYVGYAEIASRLQADAVNVYIYHQREFSGHANSVQGYRIHPEQNYVLTADITISE